MSADPAPSAVEPSAPKFSKTFERHIDQISKGLEPEDDFPKNESSWEELFDLATKLIAALAALRAENGRLERERDEALAKLAERAKQDEEIYRNAKSILARIHGQT